MTIGISPLSYGLGAVFYLILAFLLATAWRGRLQGALLLMAAIASTLWCAVLAIYGTLQVPSFAVVMLVEVARDALWFGFLFRLLGVSARGDAQPRGEVVWLLRGVAVTLAAISVALVTLYFTGERFVSAKDGVAITAFGLVVVAVLGLALVEQLYRNTRREHRWAIKLLCLGVGGMFAYDLFLYSNAMLVKQIDGNLWAARGAINALVVPLLALSAVRNPQWSLDIFVSRHVVFHSAALLGAGVYLTVMAGVGYYIREYGGAWGAAVQTIFLFGALVLLVMLLASGQSRARLRVLLNKHFFRNKYEYREEWLKFTQTLSTSADDRDLRENVISGIAKVVEAPGGTLWIRKPGGYFVPGTAWNVEPPSASSLTDADPLVGFLEDTGWVVYLDELSEDPERYESLEMPTWLEGLWRPWVVVPLLQRDRLEGFIVLARSETVRTLNWEDSDLLKTMGRQGATHLAMMRASEALAEARQFEAFNRLSSYVVHDLKNVAAQLTLVASNAKRHMGNPEFVADAMGTVENATSKMNRMLSQLRKGRLEESTTKLVNVRVVMAKVVKARAVGSPPPVMRCMEEGLIITADPERLATVMEHIVQNAQEATPATGSVQVVLSSEHDTVLIEVRDTGCGMDPGFIAERLFKPFDTTKGNAGMGIGVYETREFVQQCGGRMEVESRPGKGTCFSFRFPTDAQALGDTPGATALEVRA